jgi:predicted MPP superfamily phosphohydrolase
MRKIRYGFTLVLFLALYFTQLLVVSTNQYIFKDEMTQFCYLLPLIVIIFIAVLLISSSIISDSFFCIVYLSMSLYMGFLLYAFQMSILLRLINFFLPLSLLINFIIQYIIPLLICVYGIINALTTRIENINLKYPGFKGKIKILLLSDIHLGAIHQKNSVMRIVQETQQLNPDIVVITGDMADGSLKVKPEWLKPFDSLSMPILYITGNHEELNPKIDMINAVKTTKIKYIGQHETFKYKGVNFIGEDFGYDLRKCLREVKQEEGVPNVLLSHIPTLNPEELKNYNIFLFLAGHTHGGQMFPLHIIVYFANACFSGLYSDKNKEHFIYVTDGVNNALAPMRVGSKRVFPIINIEG